MTILELRKSNSKTIGILVKARYAVSKLKNIPEGNISVNAVIDFLKNQSKNSFG